MSKGDNVDDLIEQVAEAVWTVDPAGRALAPTLAEMGEWAQPYRDMARAALAAIAAHPRYELVELSEPTGSWAEGPEWLQGNRLGDRSGWVTWTAAGGCVMLQRVEPGELTPEGARELAAAVLAAANAAEGAK